MAAYASVKMVTVPSVWFLVAATCSALAMAAHSASYASGPSPCGSCGLPSQAPLPCDGVAGGAVLQAGPVCEDGELWPIGLLRFEFIGGCRFFLDCSGRLLRGSHVEEDRLFPAVPASEMGLESLTEGAV